MLELKTHDTILYNHLFIKLLFHYSSRYYSIDWPYDTFYGFPGNPIKPRYKRYRRLSVGEAHPSRQHHTHIPTGDISRCGCHGTHPRRMSLDIPLDPPELSEPST